MPDEMSLVDFVLYVLITWGKKASAVQNPAMNPKKSILVIGLKSLIRTVYGAAIAFNPFSWFRKEMDAHIKI